MTPPSPPSSSGARLALGPCDLIAFVAHPDDAELNCGGTLALAAKQGYKTAVVDFTRGELSTRGTPETREEETRNASRVLDLAYRVQLGRPDGHLRDDDDARGRVVEILRTARPKVVIAPPFDDHHPDHIAVAEVVARSFYLAGVKKYRPGLDPWRPNSLLHYAGSRAVTPRFVVDITPVYETRKRAIECYRSQFHDPGTRETQTRIALPEFMEWIEGMVRHYGFLIGASYGEAYTSPEPVPISNPVQVFGREKWENRTTK